MKKTNNMANDTNTVDLLQIKIERAKEQLPEDTLNAIAAVDWRAAILSLREKKGYNFEQLGDLELETELVLCGLLNPSEYPKEIEARMKISKMETNELVNEMNNLVFNKIKEELIKNTERKKIFQSKTNPENPLISPLSGGEPSASPDKGRLEGLNEINNTDKTVLKSAGIEVVKPIDVSAEKPTESREDILTKVENPESIIKSTIHPILQEKILNSVQTPTVKTEHTMENITPPSSYPPKKDPYRLAPDE